MARANKRDWYVQIDLHGGTNSAVTKPDVESSSYVHRDYLLMYVFYDRVDKGSYPPDGFSFVQNFVGNITLGMPEADWGMYVNYPDPKMDQQTAQLNYWGAHLNKLQTIKKSLDPHDVFHYPQGVLPA